MNPVSDLGAVGFALFWGVTALAAGVFAYRAYQLLRYLLLGRQGLETGNIIKRFFVTIGHFLAQVCQYKNLTRRDRAGTGHLFMVWGFFLFVIYYLLFIVIASGFGISEMMEGNRFYAYYCWIMDIAAPFIVVGALWGILRRYLIRPIRLKGLQTPEALIILITVLIHPITHVGKIATQIAAGLPPAGLGVAVPPISAALGSLYTNPATVETWHTFWFWSHWAFVLLVVIIIGYTRYLHMLAALFNDFLRTEPPKGAPGIIDLKNPGTFGASRVTGLPERNS
jgi:hypothetical protein